MADQEGKSPGRGWKPDPKELLGEGYKEIFKALLLGVLGYLGLLLGKQVPVVGDFLAQLLPLHRYQLILWLLGAFVLGFCLDRLLLSRRLRVLTDEASKDELTGLLNLRAERRILPAEMQAARDRQKAFDPENRPVEKEGLCAILLDIDNFKQVNDTAGYDSGNFVLQQFAELLDINRKVTDKVFRFGGDEFLILAPRTPPQGALMYAEKLRGTIATTKFKVHHSQPDICLTICAGIADMNYLPGDTPDDFLKRANNALLRAKQKKNCVELSR